MQGKVVQTFGLSPINKITSFRCTAVSLSFLRAERIAAEANAVRFYSIPPFQKHHFSGAFKDDDLVSAKSLWEKLLANNGRKVQKENRCRTEYG